MDKDQAIESNFVTIGLDLLEPNEGQLEGLPANPRKISESKMDLLKANLQQYPEMLSMRGLMVYPLDNGHYIIIGGNMRHRAMMELGYDSAPCIVIPKETDIERLKAYSVIDNNGFGKWDWDMLANEWDEDLLNGWGIDWDYIPPLPVADDGDGGGFVAKLTFPDKESLEKFLTMYGEELKEMYGCEIKAK
ncbi:MAG: ParB N-terminal domain-containing protein [Bacteroidales bacterium]|nr:ParB N-terminal domain-containing protein [Bacteroidales bacterium]